MPISRTINGLLTEIRCDNLTTDAWTFADSWAAPHAVWSNDATYKQEGTASLKCYIQAGETHSHSASAASPNVSMLQGARVHVWWKMKKTTLGYPAPARYWFYIYSYLGRQTAIVPQQESPPDHDWTCMRTDIPTNALDGKDYGVFSVATYIYYDGGWGSYAEMWTDHIVVSRSKYVKITGLVSGNKIEIYRTSDDVKVGEATCAPYETNVQIDLDLEEYPLYCYFKIYGTDSLTLLEISGDLTVCGGDEWYWSTLEGTMTAASDVLTFVSLRGTGTPQSATVTATLRNAGGSLMPGKTILFTTSRGELSAASDVTDANGQASAVLTSLTHGIAVVRCNWPGDGDVPAATCWVTLHVLLTAEVGDSDKAFQFYVEGVELDFVPEASTYVLASQNAAQEFSVEIPEWDDRLTRRGIVNIYREGVQEYSGILIKEEESMANPRIILGGTDLKELLATRNVTTKQYVAKSLSYIITDLLTSYYCGITPGSIDDYPTTFTIDFFDESLLSSISRLINLIGWQFRVSLGLTLDAHETFERQNPAIAFTGGVNLYEVKKVQDDSEIRNTVRARGSQTLESTAVNMASMSELGQLETTIFQKDITAQALLDIAASAELLRKVDDSPAITAEVHDEYAVGSWLVNDWITATNTRPALSGTYRVCKIERNMKDPEWAAVQLGSPTLDLADLLERIVRIVKDLGSKTTI